MPSQDDYLDELLKGMSLEEDDRRGVDQGAPDIDALSEMSEEEISKLLAAGTGSRREKENTQEDLQDMLDGTKDRELREIHDLLEKSDRNEEIEQSALSGNGTEEDPAGRLLNDIEEAGEENAAEESGSGRAREKERRRQEKASKKEAKKAARQALKEEKAKKRSKGKGQDSGTGEQTAAGEGGLAAVKEYDMMLDKDLLDSIVSGAGQAGRQSSRTEGAGGRKQAVREKARQEDESQDMGDLLSYARAGLEEADSPEAEWVEEESDSRELDIMALDLAEADALIEDRTEKEQPEKKEGIFSKVFSFLTEEDDDSAAENEDVKLSDENEEILKDLDKEKKKSGKAKKAKQKKPAKKEKKAKPKKAPKPKKEKKPRETEEAYPLAKRITLKKAMPIIVFGASLGAALFLFVFLSVDYTHKQAAREAYLQGDYEACYQSLLGKKLNEEEAVMFGRSESILYIRLWYHEYELLAEKGAETEALDSLIQTVADYPALYEYAAQWKAGMDVYEIYLDVLDTLYNKYGVTESQALEIAGVRSDLEYTRIVTAIAGGQSYDTWKDAYRRPGEGSGTSQTPEEDNSVQENQPPAGEEDSQPSEGLEDELPEESEMVPGDFVDNQ